jgi:hypothetical protein
LKSPESDFRFLALGFFTLFIEPFQADVIGELRSATIWQLGGGRWGSEMNRWVEKTTALGSKSFLGCDCQSL